MPRERTAKLLLVAESAAPGDRIDSVVGLFEGAPGRVDPDALYRARRGAFARFGVAASELRGLMQRARRDVRR